MKSFMLRGYEKLSYADAEYCDHSLKYNVWYQLVTPFDWLYFKVKKGSKYIAIYDMLGQKKPVAIVTKRTFIERWVTIVKSPISVVEDHRLYENKIKGYAPKKVLLHSLKQVHSAIMYHKDRFAENEHIEDAYEHYIGFYNAFNNIDYDANDEHVYRLLEYVEQSMSLLLTHYYNIPKALNEIQLALHVFGNLYADLKNEMVN